MDTAIPPHPSQSESTATDPNHSQASAHLQSSCLCASPLVEFVPLLAFEPLHLCCKFRSEDKEEAFLLHSGVTCCQTPPPKESPSATYPQIASHSPSFVTSCSRCSCWSRGSMKTLHGLSSLRMSHASSQHSITYCLSTSTKAQLPLWDHPRKKHQALPTAQTCMRTSFELQTFDSLQVIDLPHVEILQHALHTPAL